MFESITFALQDKFNQKSPIDIGSLVECMMFYEKVTIVADQNILNQLIRYFGVGHTIELIDAELLRINYTENYVGIVTRPLNDIEYHGPGLFSSPQHTFEKELQKICINNVGKSGLGRRQANKIQDKIEVIKHDKIITEGTYSSILDQDYILTAVKILIQELVPEINDISSIEFNTYETSSGIKVSTNINFNFINNLYHKRISAKHSAINASLLFSHILDCERELYFASNNSSELASSTLTSRLAEAKINNLLSKSRKSKDNIDSFIEFVFNDAKCIREVVNTKLISATEIVSILIKSKDFKKWVAGKNPSEDLIREYYLEVMKKSKLDKLPGKSVRWTVFTGLGLSIDALGLGGIGTMAGLSLGALDAFYLDRLIGGWKPNQFIEDEVKSLIHKKLEDDIDS